MSKRRIVLTALIVVFSAMIGWLFFDGVDLDRQYGLATFLAGMAASVFGILGIWIAVLEPKEMLDGDLNQSDAPSQQLVMALMAPWLYATGVLALSIVTVFVIAILAEYANGCVFVQRLSGGGLVLLLLVLLDSLVSTLIPVARIRKEISERLLRKQYRHSPNIP